MNDKKDLIAAVAKLSRMMRRHPREGDEMSYTAHHLLHMVMEEDGIRTTELARMAGIRPPSMTDALDRLEKNGFVVRKRDEADSRIKRVYITEKTRKEMEIRTQVKRERNARMLSCLTEKEADAFLSACEKLCAFLESEDQE